MNNDQAKNLRALVNKAKFKEEEPKPSKSYIFMGVREGVGNTTLVTNLANLLSKSGKTVAVVDINSGLMTTDVFFNIVPNYNLELLISPEKSEKEMLIKAKENLYAIYAKKLLDAPETEKKIFEQKLIRLKAEVDYLIVDADGIETLEQLQFLMKDAELILTSAPDIEGIKALYAVIKYLKLSMDFGDIGLIINKSESEKDSEKFLDTLNFTTQKFLNTKVKKMGYISKADIVMESVKRQTLFTDIYTESKVVAELEKIKSEV